MRRTVQVIIVLMIAAATMLTVSTTANAAPSPSPEQCAKAEAKDKGKPRKGCPPPVVTEPTVNDVSPTASRIIPRPVGLSEFQWDRQFPATVDTTRNQDLFTVTKMCPDGWSPQRVGLYYAEATGNQGRVASYTNGSSYIWQWASLAQPVAPLGVRYAIVCAPPGWVDPQN